jgi:hypothetical protein
MLGHGPNLRLLNHRTLGRLEPTASLKYRAAARLFCQCKETRGSSGFILNLHINIYL